jgi:predicted DNA-binding protein
MTVRNNFTMPDKVAEDVEYLSEKRAKPQSRVVQDLIEEKMAEYEIEKKLAAAEKLSGIFTGMIPEHVTIQWIKANSEE